MRLAIGTVAEWPTRLLLTGSERRPWRAAPVPRGRRRQRETGVRKQAPLVLSVL